ncbi:quinone-dependent dihydroorotate dehydrogenase [uncultured Bacteroides sp.]|uniref:quinone-dependent dihydroorotate dehydrogenase n=1 Tax=uncultured Bacteroides sp. TaxID=162156 RepID=UPI0025EE4E23|nr:quinone-dependent dihydroorotate dehydrogenase [uncultured Bacteroides sp.]
MYNSIIRPLLFRFDPEMVHRMLLNWLKFYRYLLPVRACVRSCYKISEPFSYGKLRFKNRVGLSAGFDKNVEAFDELADFGFGFLELGTVTPDSQSGNPSPRIFRLVEDESLISRTGFNNCGVDTALEHIRKYRKHPYVLGVNINKNPHSTGEQAIKDFERVFTRLYDSVDYFTLNWGSIDNDLFAKVLENLTTFRQMANKRCSIFIKLPADIDEKALDMVITLAYKYSIEGFIATGPTMERAGLRQTEAKQLEKIGNGGVSGRGIGKRSQKVVRYLSEHTDWHFLIIGAGGIMTEEDAAEMISQGADMVQIYSAFIYSGPSIVHKIGKKLKNRSI